jgi:hypothetical protein
MFTMRRFLVFLGVVLLAAIGFWFFRSRPESGKLATGGAGASTPSAAGVARPGAQAGAPAGASDSTSASNGEARITLADELNAPSGDIHHDLMILQDIFIAWRTNYPHDGNPVGENNEITAALTGANSLKLALIPANHPAINASGELCDRWGTPFVFHQLSGTRMEIRSAGPDRKLYTADDAVLTP